MNKRFHKNYFRGFCLLFAIAGALFLGSCDNKKVFDEYKEIPDFDWKRENKIAFDVQIKDTSVACNVVLNIRNSMSYPYKNIYLLLKTVYPDGSISKDTLEFYFNDDKGNYLGECSGDICENKYILKENVKFEDAGNYQFEFEHAMRTQNGNLPFIMNLGLRIERRN